MNRNKPSTPSSRHTEQETVLHASRAWLMHAVIGLNLCPFAKAVYVKDRIRYVVSDAADADALCEDLRRELQYLRATDAETTETTLLIHPQVLNDFLDYNDFLDIADALIDELRLAGEIQIASFHPQYQFADATPDAIENYTNRSPYPMLQLLREASIEKALDDYPDASHIYERNIETLRAMGRTGLEKLEVFTFPEAQNSIDTANE